MTAWYWSWILTAIGVLGLYAAGSRRSWGWLLNFFAQGMWLTYALTTEQWGFVPAPFIYGSVYLRNYRKARADAAGSR